MTTKTATSSKLKRTRFAGVRRRPDGAYVVRVSASLPGSGRVERRRVLPRGTPIQEAVKLRDRLVRQLRGDGRRTPRLADYAQRWLERKTGGDWRDGGCTSRMARGVIRNHIAPHLGRVPVGELTVSDIRRWLDGRLRTGAQPSTVRLWWAVLRAIVRAACVEYELFDPTTNLRPPRLDRRRGRPMALDSDQVTRILAWFRDEEPEWYPLVVLGFASGARISEVLAARRGDLDLDGEVGVWRITQHVGLPGRIVPGTKTSAGRVAYLSPFATAELRRLVGHRRDGSRLIAGRTAAQPLSRRGFGEALGRCARALRLTRLTSKTMRQTYATRARAAGMNDTVVREQLGHSSRLVTDVYTHLPERTREDAARQYEEDQA